MGCENILSIASTRRFRGVFVSLTGLLCVFASTAQPLRPMTAEFDAVSINLDNGPPDLKGPRMRGGPGTKDPGRFTYKGATLLSLIVMAYNVLGDQVYGRTDNLLDDKFTIAATLSTSTSNAEFRVMLQNMLASRFHLELHHETRNFPGYELNLAPGPLKFHTWISDPAAERIIPDAPLQAEHGALQFKVTVHPPMVHLTNRQPLADFASDLPGFAVMAENTRGDSEQQGPAGRGRLASLLPFPPSPRFIDKTGLEGLYEFTLDFEGSLIAGRPSEGGPTLFQALERQAGIKVVKVKSVPVDVLVIDHVDKNPTEN